MVRPMYSVLHGMLSVFQLAGAFPMQPHSCDPGPIPQHYDLDISLGPCATRLSLVFLADY